VSADSSSGTLPPTLLAPIFAVASLAFRESARSRVLHALVASSLLAFVSAYLFSYVSGGDADMVRHRKVFLDLSLSAITLLGTFAVIFLGTNLIYQEVERRTIYTVLARPVSRTGLLVGKFLGLGLVVAAAVAAMGTGFLVIFAISGGQLTLSIFVALGFAFVELMVVLAVAMFFSVAAHPIEGAVFTLVVTMAGHVTSSLNDLGVELLKTRGTISGEIVYEPGFGAHVLEKFLYGVYVLFPNLELFNLRAAATYGIPLDWARLGLVLVYAVVYATIVLAVSSFVFRRRVL
jgi:ABC-type transport system involved in multi-copper enzyme maturation permease subunit